jgi:hypothetical protein
LATLHLWTNLHDWCSDRILHARSHPTISYSDSQNSRDVTDRIENLILKTAVTSPTELKTRLLKTAVTSPTELKT